METRTQTEQEKLIREAHRLLDAGDKEGAKAIYRTLPLPAEFLKLTKESFGSQMLKDIGYNYSEAEALYGKDWLDR